MAGHPRQSVKFHGRRQAYIESERAPVALEQARCKYLPIGYRWPNRGEKFFGFVNLSHPVQVEKVVVAYLLAALPQALQFALLCLCLSSLFLL